MKKILVYGYGNPGRQDDGLGACFIELMNQWISEQKVNNVFTDCNYQLNIEDSATIADYDTVIFVDASVEDIDSFKLEKVIPDDATIEFTMHAVSVSFVLDLCQKIYHKQPETYVLHIKAYEFEFVEELTKESKKNLFAALEFLQQFILNNNSGL